MATQHVRRIRLDKIVFDAGTQVRASLDQDHVASLAEAMTSGATIPPIVLFHDGNTHYIGDGFHRFMGAHRAQWREIDAEVKPGTKADALWFALGANKTNGKNMTSADKKHAILMALRTWPERSMNDVADQIGCSRKYVQDIKAQVATTSHLPDRVTGKDGKSYPASRKNRTARHAASRTAERESPTRHEPTRPVEERRLGPPSNGLQFARIAIMKLDEIRPNDTERKQAFTLVRRWLDEREG